MKCEFCFKCMRQLPPNTSTSGSEHAYGGYCMSAPGRIIQGSLTVTESRNILTEEVKVNITVNGQEQVNQSIVKKIRRYLQLRNFPRSDRIKPMRYHTFISRTANSKVTNAYVSILIELDL